MKIESTCLFETSTVYGVDTCKDCHRVGILRDLFKTLLKTGSINKVVNKAFLRAWKLPKGAMFCFDLNFNELLYLDFILSLILASILVCYIPNLFAHL